MRVPLLILIAAEVIYLTSSTHNLNSQLSFLCILLVGLVLIPTTQELYVSSSKRDKMAISRSIVEAVRARKPSGRFLEKDVDRNLWFDIGDKKAIEKTSQALRDGAAAYRKQMSDDMSDPNFLDAVFDEDGEGNQSKVRQGAEEGTGP